MSYQQQILHSKNPFTFAVMGRGSGKSYTLSVIALLKLLQGQNVIAAAQRYDSLRDVLMRQIQLRAKEWGLSNIVKFSKNPIRATYGDFTLYGTSYECLEGARGLDDIGFLCLDECALAPLDVLDILGPCCRGPHVTDPIVFGATTPRADSMWNYRFAGMNGCEDWSIIKARTYDNITLTKSQLAFIEKSVQTPEMRKQELEAEIVLGANNHAIIRIDEFPSIYYPNSDTRVIAGLDMSKGGERDACAFFVRRGHEMLDAKEWHGVSHDEVIQYIRKFHRHTHIDQLNCDLNWSEHVYNTLKYEIDMNQIAFGERATTEETQRIYENIRAEMYFNLAWEIKHGLHIGFTKDAMLYDADGNLIGSDTVARLRQQLCAITWLRSHNGRLQLIDKDELRKLLKCSPDIADAAALTCLDRYEADDPVIVRPESNKERARKFAGMMGD